MNYIRPSFHLSSREGKRLSLVMCVTPGSDYISHYAQMADYAFRKNPFYSGQMTTIRYPSFERIFMEWTDLDSSFVQPNDRVLIGYSSHLRDHVERDSAFKEVSSEENAYYTSNRYVVNGKVVNLLGVHYSFWGNTSEALASKICKLGASEVFYYSKIGSINPEDRLYDTTYAPKHFVLMDRSEVISEFSCENQFSDVLGYPSDKRHVSVPTVIEETFSQREIAYSSGVRSIDNEIAYIARAVVAHNSKKSPDDSGVVFSSAAFSTDYLYARDEPFSSDRHNLSTNKSSEARILRDLVMDKLNAQISVYFQTS